ncbi:glycosyltransferase family 4 protein [Sphingomonas sinipercae]|uniref:Glycosyltransferase family 4 protein n=1 Tax=Sphingomonas sinipercae TaxID=2714944 RepID=A0A6G7ZND2_9SPHN|nr:glycosyltransferase family 4 protein [Sphingomonas sinipercae]QIL02432.1 glycosyltransferase family 4 protein [Sphingomonas sinipercae]
MKVLFVIKSLALQGGGAERVLGAVSSELWNRRQEVEIATFDRPGAESFYPLCEGLQWSRLGVGDIKHSTGPMGFIRQILALRALLRRHRPAIAVGFMHSGFVPLWLAATGLRTKVIASEHISFDHYRTRPLQGLLMRQAILSADLATAVSAGVREGFPEAIRQRMTVVQNPVIAWSEGSAFAGVDLEPGSENIILSVGRLEPQKDHRTLVAAFDRIAARSPDWKLRIVGDGALATDLMRAAESSAHADRIELTGTIRDIGPQYRRAKIFAMPSLYESFGLVTAEALATGMPAIGFRDCPGTNELIVDGVNGLLVDGDDRVAALAAGLERLMASPELRSKLGAAGPKSVERFSLGSVVDRWEEVLQATNRGERVSG